MDRLLDVKKYILAREPIFHHREFTSSRADVERETTADYFEISASGCDYTRDFVLDYLEQRYAEESVDAMVAEHWEVKDFKIKRLASELYLVNYTLYGQGRVTKRGEIWVGNLSSGLKVMYHQGTVVDMDRVQEHRELLKKMYG